MRVMKKSELASIQEDMKVNMHCPVVGFQGTPLGFAFNHYIGEYGLYNTHYICSMVYNLGMMHGKRVERARRKRAEQASRTNEANGNGTESETERLRRYIYDMASQIRSEKRLRQIYTAAHRSFINDRLEVLNERQD